MNLTAENVTNVFKDCLFTDDELKAGKPTEFVEVDGVATHVGFNPKRLEAHREDVASMLSGLPSEFMHDNPSGGWSFLQACNDKSGQLWTGLHAVVDQLLVLGLGLNMVKYLLPREFWKALPGGVPYFTINIKGFPKEEPAKQD